MLEFRTVWPEIYRQLPIGTKIPNWSVEGYTGKDTRIEDTNYDEIVVSAPGTKRHKADRADAICPILPTDGH
jgi:hypothetical protein